MALFQFSKDPAGDHREEKINEGCGNKGLPHPVILGIRCVGPVHELRRGDDGGQGRVLDKAHKGISQGRDHGPDSLGQDHVPHALPSREAQGAGRLHLSGVRGKDAAPDGLGDIGPRIDGQRQHRRQHAIRLFHNQRHHTEIGDEELQQERRPPDAFDKAGRRNGQPFFRGNPGQRQEKAQKEPGHNGHHRQLDGEQGTGHKERRIFLQDR